MDEPVRPGPAKVIRHEGRVDGVRELAGTADEPMSQATFDALSLGASVGVAALSGHAFATQDEFGRKRFNWGAATLLGALTFAVIRTL